ncbi:MAG: hypothetical protein HONBIEJF_00109 [Fimbriimonadaceae bacterium]|nr:hypothetical protein [Fimbriimonadaceae bacterium]
MLDQPFFSHVLLREEELVPDRYPLTVAAARQIGKIRFHPNVTIFAGENGSGKSTIVEALAVAAGFPIEGGRRDNTRKVETGDLRLADSITLVKCPNRPKDGFFFRSENISSFALYIRETDKLGPGTSFSVDLHEVSHGESYFQILHDRFVGREQCLMFFDEIEAALSPQRQLELLFVIERMVRQNCMFIISTHSPILMSYPRSRLYWLDGSGIEERHWQDTEHYLVTHSFLLRPDIVRAELLREDQDMVQ